MMVNVPEETWTSSLKEQRRKAYKQKRINAQRSARRPFTTTKRWKNSHQWKESSKVTKNQLMDTIYEESFQPHFGMETLDATSFLVDVILKSTGIKCSDDIIKEIEGLGVLLIAISKSVDMTGVMSNIFLYVREKYNGSVSREIVKYICETIGYSTQSGLENTDDEPGWLKFIKNVRTSWITCIGDGLFSTFSKVLSLLVIAGLTSASDLTFSLGSFKIIEPDLRLINSKASDLVTAVCDIVIFFCERSYHAWKTQSLRPFFAHSTETAQLEVTHATLLNHWDLFRSGNLTKIAKVSEHDFLRALEDHGSKLKSLLPGLTGVDRRLIEEKYRSIVKIISSFNIIKVNSGFKRAPFALEYYGESKVGKSTVSEQVAHYLFTSAGLSTEDGRKYTHISGKKHWDGCKSDALELKLDDHNNTKSQFVETSPCDVLVKTNNNVPFSPPMADLVDKAKVWTEFELISLSTNTKDLGAGIFSNCPYSIQRRMHYVLTIKVKDMFREKSSDGISMGIDTAKVIASHTKEGVYDPPIYHDIWEIDVEKAVPPADMRSVGTYEVVTHHGKKMKDVSLQDTLNFLCERFHEHREQQFKLLDNLRIQHAPELCSVDDCKQIKGFCTKHLHAQLGLESLRIDRVRELVNDNTYVVQTREALLSARLFYDRFDWVPYVPMCVLRTRAFAYVYSVLDYRNCFGMYKRYSRYNCFILFSCMSAIMWSNCNSVVASLLTLSVVSTFVISQYLMINYVRDKHYRRLLRRHTLNEVEREWQDNMMKGLFVTAAALGAIYQVAKVVKRYRSFGMQGSLEPKTQREILERDKEVNVWTGVTKRELPITTYSRRMSANHMDDIVRKALVYGSIHLEDGNAMVNGLMISSNVMLIPDHYFQQFGNDLDCTFRKKNPESAGGKFVARLSRTASYHVPNTDLRLCYVPNGGSFKNLVNFFPIGDMPSVPFRMYWRRKDGDITQAKGMTKPGKVRTISSFKGGTYENLTIDTFDGLCGATLVSETNGSVILGVHLGGIAGSPKGCYGSLTQQEISEGFKALRELEGVVLSGGAGHFRTDVLGVQVLRSDPLHAKSALNYLPHNSQIEYYGSCPGRAITKTSVKVTPISQHITDICGVPNVYRGPKLNPEWFGWQACLENLSIPAHPFPHALLVTAIKDYKEPLLPIFRSSLWKNSRPLTDHENLCGVPGQKFMDAIKLNTSVGFPLSGPKRDFVEDLEPTRDKPNNRALNDVLMKEINRLEECYKRGERGYPIAKACKKDEILSKPKCRIFYGNALSLTWLIRKYYLPLLRVLQMNPLKSECAVGINAHGPEWNEFYMHATKFGSNRLFGGDYGKYDQKLPSQLIFAALRILIDFARECDYSEEDLGIMEAMTGDIVFAYIAFNGDLIGLTEGAHISGNSLTVIINGICGSLNLRCFFYTQYPTQNFKTRYKFRDCVAVMTYGDDNIGSVKHGFDKFNIRDCSKFLGEYGQVYTMPDKESELLSYLPPEQFEFLKRKSVFHPKLGVHIGALLDKSIYKSLHCFIRDKNCVDTEETACAMNIDTALREWFNHGEEKYEHQRTLMKEVAHRSGISHICSRLSLSYSECAESWVNTYVTPETLNLAQFQN